jgi:ABC-type lipoprotein export system ATPase subunit
MKKGGPDAATKDPGTGWLFRLRGIRREYGRDNGLSFVSGANGGSDPEVIEIPVSSMLAVVGPSGCGKSTLLAMLSLLDRADSGTIVHNRDGALTDYSSLYRQQSLRADHIKAHFAHIFQTTALLPYLSVEENLQFRAWMRGEQLDTAWFRDMVERLRVGRDSDLPPERILQRSPLDLSVGEGSRVGVLRALVGPQQVVFADEPTANMDTVSEAETLGLLRQWAHQDRSRCVVFVTHLLKNAWDYCDHFLVLRREGKRVIIDQYSR